MEGKIFGVNLALIILILALLIPLGLLGGFNLKETMQLRKEIKPFIQQVSAPVATPAVVNAIEAGTEEEPVAAASPTPAPKKVKVKVDGQQNSSTSSSANTINTGVVQ